MTKGWLSDIVVCQQCLGKLTSNIEGCFPDNGLLEGTLTCKKCNIVYPISKGILFFGVPVIKAQSLLTEMDQEFIWNFERTSLSEHLSHKPPAKPEA
jgi:uncharacterized protein YbaR (Trm112 family)